MFEIISTETDWFKVAVKYGLESVPKPERSATKVDTELFMINAFSFEKARQGTFMFKDMTAEQVWAYKMADLSTDSKVKYIKSK